jgi:hypothetical protein
MAVKALRWRSRAVVARRESAFNWILDGEAHSGLSVLSKTPWRTRFQVSKWMMEVVLEDMHVGLRRLASRGRFRRCRRLAWHSLEGSS